jgi:amino acid transporter
MATADNKIGLLTATTIGINAMLGAGIFLLPRKMALLCGPAGILTTLCVATAVWFIGYCIARVATNIPGEGSFYLYIKQWGGHKLGLLISTLYIVGLMIAIGLWALVIALNMSGAHLSSIGQRILICTTVIPLILITILCFSKAHMSYLIPFAPYGYKNVILASRLIIFSFFGFEAIAALVGHLHNPQRTMPRALMFAIAIVGILYICFLSSFFLSIPLDIFASTTTVPQALAYLFPQSTWLLELINFAILSALTGCAHSIVWSVSNLVVSLIKTCNNTLGTVARINPGYFQKYAVMLVGLGILTSFILLSGDQFFYFTALFVVTAYAATIITLLTIKKERTPTNLIIISLALLATLMIVGFAIDGIVTSII